MTTNFYLLEDCHIEMELKLQKSSWISVGWRCRKVDLTQYLLIRSVQHEPQVMSLSRGCAASCQLFRPHDLEIYMFQKNYRLSEPSCSESPRLQKPGCCDVILSSTLIFRPDKQCLSSPLPLSTHLVSSYSSHWGAWEEANLKSTCRRVRINLSPWLQNGSVLH